MCKNRRGSLVLALKKIITTNNNTISKDNSHYNSILEEYPVNKNNKENKNNSIESDFQIEIPRYSFKDIILQDRTREHIQDVIYAKQYKSKVFDEWGLSTVMSENSNKLAVNLYGPPGTGKTMAAHVIANEMNRNLLCVNYSEIESKYVGETSKNLEKVFKFAKEKNLIIFFDEADAMLSKRVSNMNSSTDVSVNQTRSVLLMLMNDYEDVILFATNFINNFDEAFMRRIHFHIKFEFPCKNTRKVLWEKYIPKSMPNTANIDELSEIYDGITGSDIANAVKVAAFKAARLQENYVDNKYFHESIRNIINSKKENKTFINQEVTERFVTEGYVKSQINIGGDKK